MKIASALIALVCAVVLALPSLAQEAPAPAPGQAPAEAAPVYSLLTKWKVGQSYRQKLTLVSASEQDNPALGKIETSSTTTMIASETVKSIAEDGTVSTELEYESIALKSKSMAGESEWDSTRADDEQAASPEAQIYRIMLKHKYAMKYDAKGQLTDVKGFDVVLERFLEAQAKDAEMDEAALASMRKIMERSMGDKAMLRMMGQQNILPAQPVAGGATWDLKLDVPLPMMPVSLLVEGKLTLVSVAAGKEGTIATIKGEGTIKSKPTEKAEEEADKDGKEDGKEDGKGGEPDLSDPFSMFDVEISNGKQRFDVQFDLDRGAVVKQVISQSFDMLLILKAGDIEINQKTTNVNTIELLPPKAAEADKPESESEKPAKTPEPKPDNPK